MAVRSMIDIYGSGLTHDVCRQAGVRGRMYDLRLYLVSCLKTGRPSKRPIVWCSSIYDPSHSLRCSGRSGRLRRMGRDRPRTLFSHAAIGVSTADDALCFQNLFVAIEPLFVIAGHEIKPVRHILDCRSLFRRRVDACNLTRNSDAMHAALPGRMERWLVRLRHNRSDALLSPNVMDALHVDLPALGKTSSDSLRIGSPARLKIIGAYNLGH